MFSVMETRPTSLSPRMARASSITLRLRDQRSRVWTTTTSKLPFLASSNSWQNTGRPSMVSTCADLPAYAASPNIPAASTFTRKKDRLVDLF